MSFLRQYLTAVQNFTRVPVTGSLAEWMGTANPVMLRASAAHFPGVGWLIGIAACASFSIVGLMLPGSVFAPLPAAIACTAAGLLLTGGVHERGLSRMVDRLAVTSTVDAGASGLGAIALMLALLAKLSLLAVLASQSPVAVLAALLAGHVLSRFWPLLLVRGLPYVGDTAEAKRPLTERITPRVLGIAGAWSLGALALAVLAKGWAFAILPMLASGLALLWMRRVLRQRLRGFDDDALGATQQACELMFYLGAAVALNLA